MPTHIPSLCSAGVLRGAKGRFQLFGDSVNMAQRIESTSRPHEIQVSESTAQLLIRDGAEHWLVPREGNVHLKGKGVVKTFWCKPKGGRRSSMGSATSSSLGSMSAEDADVGNTHRLIKWNSKILYGLLEEVSAYRDPTAVQDSAGVKEAELASLHQRQGKIVLDELTQILAMPPFKKRNTLEVPEMSLSVEEQLDLYVTEIANRYRR